MRAGALQLDVRRGDVDANLAAVERGLRAAAEQGLRLVLLPEMWPTSFVHGLRPERDWWPPTRAALERVQELSRELGLVVAGSSFGPPRTAGARRTNRLTVFADGALALAYDKVHLFSPTAEREGFSAGDAPPATVAIDGWRVSGAVCYDLRFASLLRAPWLDEAELLLVPAQWPAPRAAHFRALVLGRAAEHQAFVLAANRTGREPLGRPDRGGGRAVELEFPGNSIVAAPDGTALAEGRGEEGLVAAELDRGAVRALRRAVPVRRDERPDLG